MSPFFSTGKRFDENDGWMGWRERKKKNLNEQHCSSDRTAAHGWDGTVQDWTDGAGFLGGWVT